MKHRSVFTFFFVSLVAGFVWLTPLLFAQSPSQKSIPLDTDWEKIRDAQVQMLKKKEAELDRLKEDLLNQTRPQSETLRIAEAKEAVKKVQVEKEAARQDYENRINLLKQKSSEQKKEIEKLQSELKRALKNKPEETAEMQAVPNIPVVVLPEIARREADLKLKEDALLEKESKLKDSENTVEVQAEFEKEKASWELEKNRMDAELQSSRADLEQKKNQAEKLNTQLQAQAEQAAQDQRKWEQEFAHLSQRVEAAEQVSAAHAGELEVREKKIIEDQKAFETQLKDWEVARRAEEEKMKRERAELEAEKTVWQEEKAKTEAAVLKATADSQAKDISDREQVLFDREEKLQAQTAQLDARERAMQIERADLDDRQQKIMSSQKQLVEERREWQIERNKKEVEFEGAQKEFTETQGAAADWVFARSRFEKQIEELKQQIQAQEELPSRPQDEWLQKEAVFKKHEDEMLQKINEVEKKLQDSEAQAQGLRSQLALEQSQKEAIENEGIKLQSQVSALDSKVKQLEIELERFETENKELRDKAGQADAQDGEMQKHLTELKSAEEHLQKDLAQALEENKRHREVVSRLESQESVFHDQAIELELKIKQLESEKSRLQTELSEKGAATVGSADLKETQTQLQQAQLQNEKWKEAIRKYEQKENEWNASRARYESEISTLKSQPVVSTPAVTVDASGGRDWGAEARRVVDERRALSEEKTNLYRRFAQEKQAFDQEKIQFLRRQREFEDYLRNEEIRLERLRRQQG